MSFTARDPGSLTDRAGFDEIKNSLGGLERMFEQLPDRHTDPDFVAQLGDALRTLHARIRVRHAAGYVDEPDVASLIPAHLVGERQRLLAEHSIIIGLIDRLVRLADSLAGRSSEDLDVLELRGRELIAVLRRHEAEEDRLFYQIYWTDDGGEGA